MNVTRRACTGTALFLSSRFVAYAQEETLAWDPISVAEPSLHDYLVAFFAGTIFVAILTWVAIRLRGTMSNVHSTTRMFGNLGAGPLRYMPITGASANARVVPGSNTRFILSLLIAFLLTGVLFEVTYPSIMDIHSLWQPDIVDQEPSVPDFRETRSPDGSYLVHLSGLAGGRIRLGVLPLYKAIPHDKLNNYVVLDVNSGLQVDYVWKSPRDLVVQCLDCTPIQIARTRNEADGAKVTYRFAPPDADESHVVISMPAKDELTPEEFANYRKMIEERRTQHPYRF